MTLRICQVATLLVWTLCPICGVASGEPPATAPTSVPSDEAWRPIDVKMTMNQTALDMAACGAKGSLLFLNGMHLTDVKPAAIGKEPAYLGKPYYGAFKVGNGPKNLTYLAIDQIADQDEKIYVDINQNGDLTDDGSSAWDHMQLSGEKKQVYEKWVTLHASWSTDVSAVSETESDSYSFFISKVRGEPKFGFYKTSARVGTLEFEGKSYPIMLSENTMDAVFTIPALLDRTRSSVIFSIDLDGDGTFKGVKKQLDDKPQTIFEQYITPANPVQLGDRWFFVRPNISGSELRFIPSAAPNAEQQMVATADPFDSRTALKSGTVAPDFTALASDGKSIKLSDFKGKVVLLDFWATWCGPCQQSMPPLEKVYQQVKDQGVVVLSVNVLDEKKLFDDWIAKHSGTDYSFTFAFDPAGKDDDSHKSIATKTYGVMGIPTMFVIDRNGKIFDTIEGAGTDDRVKIALRGLSVKVN